MAPEAWLTLVVVVGVVVVLATDRIAPSATLFGAVVLLLAAEVIDPAQAFSGFSNPAPITVAALYVLAAAVDKTGALQPILATVLGRARGRRLQLARLSTPVASASAFLNNMPIVAMFVPQIQGWCERNNVPVSRYLIPLSFASIMGGMVTLIGTSTNIVVAGLFEASGRPALGMLEITPVGLPVAVLGLVAMVVLAPVLLPDRRGATELRRRTSGSSRWPCGSLPTVPWTARPSRTRGSGGSAACSSWRSRGRTRPWRPSGPRSGSGAGTSSPSWGGPTRWWTSSAGAA